MAGEFAARLRHLRVAVGLSQGQLARRAGIDPAYVNILERRQRTPSQAVTRALAESLGLDPGETDRLLWLAGLAPVEDWQTRCLLAEGTLDRLQRILGGERAAPRDGRAERREAV